MGKKVTLVMQGGAKRVRPCPWGDNEKRRCTLHWLFMDLGGHVPPLLGVWTQVRKLLIFGKSEKIARMSSGLFRDRVSF